MKTLTNIQTVISGTKATITADIVDKVFGFPVQQVTIGFMPDNNPKFLRHVQISHEALFVKAYGTGFAIPLEDLMTKVAMVIEPKLSFPPVLKKVGALTVELVSELQPVLQWQQAPAPNSPEEDWKDIEGANDKSLDSAKTQKGTWVRCKATSESGIAITPPIKI